MIPKKPSMRDKMVQSGTVFELLVSSKIHSIVECKTLANKKYMDFRLGRGVECDVIVVTDCKVYCVECKGYNGFISGDKYSDKWRFASSGKIGNVQNPYLLNRRRIRMIRGSFYRNGVSPIPIANYIVVPDKCNIHVEGCNVVSLSSLLSIIRNDSKMLPKIYNRSSLSKFLSDVSVKFKSES